jgi:hypothetical protein
MERTRPDARSASEAGEPAAVQVQIKGEATCPLCLDPLTTLPKLEVCTTCRTIHHSSCVNEFGRCGTPACQGLARATPVSRTPGDENERGIAAVSHVAAFFGGGLLVPLGIWYFTRDRQPYAAHHAWRAFVFQLASIPLTVVTFGLWLPLMLFLTVRAAVRSWRGEWVPYGRPDGEPAAARPESDAVTAKSGAKAEA